jgi:TonB family protein
MTSNTIKRDRPGDLLIGLVTSIFLHWILLMGSNYWLTAFVPKQKQDIPIDYVEVPPDKTQIPPKTSRLALKNSIAGGKALLKRPVSVVKSANSSAPKVFASSPKDLRFSSAAKVFQTAPEQPTGGSTSLSPQKLPLKPLETVNPLASTPPAPKPQKIVVAPTTTPQRPKPLQTAIAPVTTPPAPKPQKIAVAPTTTPQQPKPLQTAIAPVTTPPAPKPQKIAVAPTTTPQQPKPLQTAIAPANTPPAPKPQKLGQSGTKLSEQTQSQVRPSLKTGAASRLGGPLSISSSRNSKGDYLAALPNTNRDSQAPFGIDARRQNTDISSYLKQLQQRVKQQWLPGLSQSSRRTVLNFTVSRSGQVSNLQIAQTSGFSVTDQGALNAIQRAAPFTPLPTGYTKKYIQIQFTFDINVYGELNLSRDGN